MSSPSISRENEGLSSLARDDANEIALSQWLVYALTPLASLKLTVTFFALAIFLIFAGTLAQVEQDIWEVVDQYFRSAFVRIPLQVFFPASFFPSNPQVPGAFWFPGGWLIGAVLAVNLLSAHLLRFKIQAKGSKLMLGLGVLGVGALATWMVIQSGSNADGLQAEPVISWTTLWRLMQLSLVGVWLGSAYVLLKLKPDQKTEWWSLATVVAGLGVFLAWMFVQGDGAQLGDSSMRILWQLIKATLVGLILLAGCAVLFGKRAGVVLLHGGIGLMMFSEVLVGVAAVETRMSLSEGQTVNFVFDTREIEFAFINASNSTKDVVTVVPGSMLKVDKRVSDDRLPLDFEIVHYYQNANIRDIKPHLRGRDVHFVAPETWEELPASASEISAFRAIKVKPSDGKEESNAPEVLTGRISVTEGEADDGSLVTKVNQWRSQVGLPPANEKEIRSELETLPSAKLSTQVIEITGETKASPSNAILGAMLRFEGKTWFATLSGDASVVADEKGRFTRFVESFLINPSKLGLGRYFIAQPIAPSTGTDTESGVDVPAAYVKLYEKGSATPLGTFLFSAVLRQDTITHGDGHQVDVDLRFKRTYMPYTVTLLDVRKDDYLGTDTPRNYSSDIRIVEADGTVHDKIHIWMNNPLRYAGATFYQSGYNKDERTGIEGTSLQVVTNTGWMIPYVSCMIVAVGLLAHFGITLLRFLNRRQREEAAALAVASTAGPPDDEDPYADVSDKKRRKRLEKKLAKSEAYNAVPPNQRGLLALWFPIAVVVVFGGWLLSQARAPKYAPSQINYYGFGEIAVVSGGRQQPIDSLARNTLREISNYQTLKMVVDEDGNVVDSTAKTSEDGEEEKKTKTVEVPAIRWFLDVVTQSDDAEHHRVFRIDHPEIVSFFELERVKGHRYSLAQLRPKAGDFHAKVDEIKKKGEKQLTVLERRYIELDRRIRSYTMLVAAFSPPPIPELPTDEEFQKNPQEARQKFMAIGEGLMQFSQSLSRMSPPLAVPVGREPVESGDADATKEVWEPYSIAWSKAFLGAQMLNQEPEASTLAWNKMLTYYSKGDVENFNKTVAEYKELLATNPPVNVDYDRVEFEAFFNKAAPFYHASVLYVLVFVLAASAWFGWSRPLNRAAFWLTIFTFVVHTAALIARIYISGRPPVTNLYSSAIFIGWGAVIFGIVFEMIYKLGIGNLLAGISGFSTLLIAHLLAADGDTFVVLQAVLDTQFWLATHVVCITLGYATTFVAGILGIVYIVRGLFTTALTREVGKDLTRMIYGTLCFAIFFSFVGTVLGGLWADDSWGRFWGWDPKENGALIIVLWNALVLHARWGAMVKDRGMAVLAVAGNIATAWSWFGVNELGVGLHSYGFTEGVLLALGLFVLSQLAIIAAGSLPQKFWRSRSLAA